VIINLTRKYGMGMRIVIMNGVTKLSVVKDIIIRAKDGNTINQEKVTPKHGIKKLVKATSVPSAELGEVHWD